ncbi:M20/M25/M40 family metallo-hydrolase [bacterium]|nr:M20/M25/M40 family metallo-hydrolase [bacterium]
MRRAAFMVFLTLMQLPALFSTSAAEPDYEDIGREAARILADLVRINTTNPPGNESKAVDYLARLFDREGVLYVRTAEVDGRENIIARYHGSGEKRPILLYSHTDVVPADAGWGEWTVDPFSGIVRDGILYGRGAIDAKGLVAVHAATMLLLKRENIPLDRDVIFLAAAAEETGGGPGIAWLLEEHRELIDAEYALGEGGRVQQRADSVWSVWVQAGEKAAHNLTVTALGTAKHAAIPSRYNAIDRLTDALVRLRAHTFPPRPNAVTEAFRRNLESVAPELFPRSDRYDAMQRTTISVTLIEGGIKTNVIPDYAEANLNLRLVPGEDLDSVVTVLNDVVADENVKVAKQPWAVSRAGTVSFETPFYNAIESTANVLWPHAVVTPYLSPGTSDASKLRDAGIIAYGLMPFPLTAAESDRVHGVDESIRLDALQEGIRFTYELLKRWSGTDPKTAKP